MNSTIQDRPEASLDTAERLKSLFLKVVKSPLPPASVTASTNLYELGLESMNVVELLTDIEAEWGIVFDIEELNAELFSAFGRLAAFVESKRDGRA